MDSDEEREFRELAGEMKGEILFTLLSKKNMKEREALTSNRFE
jgi:hypothetical protein